MKTGYGRDLQWLRLAAFLGAVLAGSAILKLLDWKPIILNPNSERLTVLLTSLELFIAIWLISRTQICLAWLASLILFSVFLFVSIFKMVQGTQSCGCFGEFSISPIYMIAFDLAVLIAIVIWRPSSVDYRKFLTPKRLSVRGTKCAILVGISCLVAPIAITSFEHQFVQGKSPGIVMSRGIALLDPPKWIGTRFPLADYLDHAEMLKSGEWTVLLAHSDCTKCLKRISELSKLPDVSVSNAHIAIIVFPPVSRITEANDSVVFYMPTSVGWFVETPVELSLEDGIVVSETAY